MKRFALLFIPWLAVPAAGQTDIPYRLSALAGAGYNFYISETPQFTSTSGGFSGTVRVMWKAEHRLSVGLESGYIYMYTVDEKNLQTEFGTTDVFGARSGVPISIVFTMDIVPGFQVTVGGGQMVVIGTAESFGSRVHSTSLSTAFLGAASYMWPMSGGFELGGEVKWYHATKFEDSGISFQVVGRWTFLEW